MASLVLHRGASLLCVHGGTAVPLAPVMDAPVLLKDSVSACVPTGTPLLPVATQTRVTGL